MRGGGEEEEEDEVLPSIMRLRNRKVRCILQNTPHHRKERRQGEDADIYTAYIYIYTHTHTYIHTYIHT
jgi:hypothetical protein